MSLHAKLQQRAAEGRPVRIGLIGAGKFGSMYLAQIPRTPGVHLVGIADLSPDARARATWRASAGATRSARRPRSLDEALKTGATHVGDDWRALVRAPGDRRRSSSAPATRSPRSSTAWKRSRSGKHVVNVTVEADAFCGPLLARKAAEAGVVYSLAFGDQPALICDLVDWARTCGFPVVAAGRGHKWLPHFSESTPETVWGNYGLTPEQADARRAEPEDVQQLPRRLQAVDRIDRGVQRHRPDRAEQRPALPAGERRGHPVRDAADRAKAACSSGRAWSR